MTVEFLFTFPAFLVLFLLVLELSLMWMDRHVLKLAAFEAARAVLATPRDDRTTWCWPQPPAARTSRGDAAQSAAKRAAVLKVALVTPPPEYFLSRVLDKVQGLVDVSALQSILRSSSSSSPSAAPGRALVRLLKGIPAAYALTHLECRMDAAEAGGAGDGSVYLKLTYFRPPRMPFVGGIFWAAYAAQTMNRALTKAGVGELLQFHVDPLTFHDLRADAPLIGEAKAQVAKAKADAQAIVAKGGEFKTTLDDLVNMAQLSPELTPYLDSALLQAAGGLGGAVDRAAVDVQAGIAGMATAADDAVDAAAAPLKRALDQTAVATTLVVYAVPESFRLIPMTVEVRLMPLGTPVVHNDEEWTDGEAKFLTPFTTGQGQDDAYGRYTRAVALHGLTTVDAMADPTDTTPDKAPQGAAGGGP